MSHSTENTSSRQCFPSFLTLSLPQVPKRGLIDFTLSNARRFYSSMGNPLGMKGLKVFIMYDLKIWS